MKISFVYTFTKPLWRWWLFQFIPFKLEIKGLIWKEKWNLPRVEMCPYLEITILNNVLTWYFGDDEYWERKLWLKKYCNGDKLKAKETWP